MVPGRSRPDTLPLTPLGDFLRFLVIQKHGFDAEARIPLNQYSEDIKSLTRRERADALRDMIWDILQYRFV